MKKINTLLILSSLLLFSFCKNEGDTSHDSKSNNKDTFLTATINGEEFISSVKIVTFRANKQTFLTSSDNSNSKEYAFNLIIENNKEGEPKPMRYGFVEKENENGKNKKWKLPDNFDFKSSLVESGNYLEGTFSFVANSFEKGIENTHDQLVVTNGKFRAITSQGMREQRNK